MNCHSSLPWPLASIDFEASSLDGDGYPIEAGLALWPAPGEPILGWSALIRPAWRWILQGCWNPASARVHGLCRSDLAAHGLGADRIAPALNAVLRAGSVAWCDDGGHDAHWTRALFTACGVRPHFTLGDWHRLVSVLGEAGRDRTLSWLTWTPTPRRAPAGAERRLLALAHGAGLDPEPVGDLASRMPTLPTLVGAFA